jgi:hypothetical protein
MALYQARAKQILDAIHSVAALPANTGSVKLRLFTVTSTAAAAGTEVVAGGGYATGGSAFTMQAAVNGASPPVAQSDNNAVSFSNMPRAETITGIDITDSAATPVPQAFGGLTASKLVAAGDSLSFAAAAIRNQINT